MRRMISFWFFILFMVLTQISTAQQWGLYTLYAKKNDTKAYLIDTADSPATYKTWTFSSTKKTAYSAYLIPGDTLVRTYSYTASGGLSGGGVTGGVQKISWNGTVAWDFQYNSSTYTIHHDICPLPNGNVLMIAYEVKTAAQATQAGCSSSMQLKSEKIMEVHPTSSTTGTVVWEWHLWDHLCQNYSSAKDNYVSSIIDNPQLLNINYSTASGDDRWHMNGIDYDPIRDQIVLSMHYMNSIFVIDHSTTTAEAAGHTGGIYGKGGDFLYRWGNPASYGATGTTVFTTIHDAHWVSSSNPNYPSYLCAYNNEGGTNGKTAINIWLPPYDGDSYTMTPGQTTLPSASAYQYNSSFTATNEGNSHQLPNGNMLVNNAFGSVYEINSSGTVLWSKNTQSSHAYRFSLCEVRGPIAYATASETTIEEGESVNLSSSYYSPTETNPTISYAWSNGDNDQNPTITPSVSGTYIVTITNTALGCYDTASVYIEVTPSSGLTEAQKGKTHLYPNPSNGFFTIAHFEEAQLEKLEVYEMSGKMLLCSDARETIDLTGLNNGIYFVKLIGKTENLTQKIVIRK